MPQYSSCPRLSKRAFQNGAALPSRGHVIREKPCGLRLIRIALAIPINPVPSRAGVAGSGTLAPVPVGASSGGDESTSIPNDAAGALPAGSRPSLAPTGPGEVASNTTSTAPRRKGSAASRVSHSIPDATPLPGSPSVADFISQASDGAATLPSKAAIISAKSPFLTDTRPLPKS